MTDEPLEIDSTFAAMGYPLPSSCSLLDAVWWIAYGRPPLHDFYFSASPIRIHLSELVKVPETILGMESLFFVLSTGALNAVGVLKGETYQVRSSAWLFFEDVDWAQSLLRMENEPIENIVIPTRELLKLFPPSTFLSKKYTVKPHKRSGPKGYDRAPIRAKIKAIMHGAPGTLPRTSGELVERLQRFSPEDLGADKMPSDDTLMRIAKAFFKKERGRGSP